ncbi:hypothetical protein OHB35_26770 [Streptomyces phaeochromogenes]|uniref:Uncharacterized protein n=1 Tax=Streptomyces phaeochromogenes TaxID=1923 RepID=A0ABZ1HG89_STRPH|nr:hypothetical protein [Streptomyces phaeochromogenes]WSD16556.1 hypothetical protein OHB35_26770 [Streptomyces phaeochromogenes]
MAGVLDQLDGPAVDVARLGSAGPDLAHRALAVRRAERTHLVCFGDLSTDLVTDRLRDTGRVRPGRAAATAGMGRPHPG